ALSPQRLLVCRPETLWASGPYLKRRSVKNRETTTSPCSSWGCAPRRQNFARIRYTNRETEMARYPDWFDRLDAIQEVLTQVENLEWLGRNEIKAIFNCSE